MFDSLNFFKKPENAQLSESLDKLSKDYLSSSASEKIKKAVTVTGSYLMYYLAGIPFKDCTNAFKMFSKNLKDRIKLKSTTGFTFAMELTTKSYLFDFKIVEIPSIWIDETGRKSNFKVLKWLRFYIYWMLYAMVKNFLKKFK